jgi:hypothetical protein
LATLFINPKNEDLAGTYTITVVLRDLYLVPKEKAYKFKLIVDHSDAYFQTPVVPDGNNTEDDFDDPHNTTTIDDINEVLEYLDSISISTYKLRLMLARLNSNPN